jgi:hypothetical protein
MIWADPSDFAQFDGTLSAGGSAYQVRKGIIGNNQRLRSQPGESLWAHANRAYDQGMIIYNKAALQGFMDRVGGKVFVRGHQEVGESPSGSEINFDGLMANIHSTGMGSSESRYQTNSSTVAEFNQDTTVDKVKDENVKPVFSSHITVPVVSSPLSPPAPVPVSTPAPVPTPTAITPPVTTTAAPAVVTAPSAETLPQTGNLVDNINGRLSTTTESSRAFEATPKQLAEYLQTIPLPFGAKFQDVQMKTDSGKLIINGVVGGGFGRTDFNLVVQQDPSTHELKVVSHTINTSGAHSLRKDDIERNLTDINTALNNQINQRVNPDWKISNMDIGDNELKMNFSKK